MTDKSETAMIQEESGTLEEIQGLPTIQESEEIHISGISIEEAMPEPEKELSEGNGREAGELPEECEITVEEQVVSAPGRKKPVILFPILAVVVVIAAILVIVLMSKGDRKTPSDPRVECNFNNGGKFAFDDDTLFFVGEYDDNADDTSVFATSYSGTRKTLLTNDSDIIKIRVVGEQVLFQSADKSMYTIGIMNKDGTDEKTIINKKNGEDDSLNDFDAAGGVLYYVYNQELRSCSTSGTNDTLILEGVNEFVLDGKTLYCALDASIIAYDIRKNTSTEIYGSEGKNLVYADGKIYFSNDSGIYSVVATGGQAAERIIKEESIGNYTITGDDLYYIKMYDPDYLAEIAVGAANDLDIEVNMDNAEFLSLAYMVFNTGEINHISLEGGTSEIVESEEGFKYALFAYPAGLYSQVYFLYGHFLKETIN